MEEEKKELSRAAKWRLSKKNDPKYIEKQRQRNKDFYEQHKDDPYWIAKRYAKSSETGKERSKLYRERHPEKIAEKNAAYYFKKKYGCTPVVE